MCVNFLIKYGRSREGAWIEITGRLLLTSVNRRRSREGAWIEISVGAHDPATLQYVAPARERGLKLVVFPLLMLLLIVAPARERGLKS